MRAGKRQLDTLDALTARDWLCAMSKRPVAPRPVRRVARPLSGGRRSGMGVEAPAGAPCAHAVGTRSVNGFAISKIRPTERGGWRTVRRGTGEASRPAATTADSHNG